MAKLDEVALNTLLAEGLDVPTAYMASVRDVDDDDVDDDDDSLPARRNAGWTLGLCVGLIVVWLVWSLI